MREWLVSKWVSQLTSKLRIFSNPENYPQTYVPNCYFKSRIWAPLSVWVSKLEKKSPIASSCESAKIQKFTLHGDKSKTNLKLIIIKNEDNTRKTYEIPKDILLRFLLNGTTLKSIERLEANAELDEHENTNRKEMLVKLDFLTNNVDKEAKIAEVEFYKYNKVNVLELMVRQNFIVFKTTGINEEFWWSLEKKPNNIVMQRCSGKGAKESVVNKFEGKPRKSVEKIEEKFEGNCAISDIFQNTLVQDVIGESYQLFKSDCQQLFKFLSKKITAYEAPLSNGITRNILDLTKIFKFSDWTPIQALIYMDKFKLLEAAFQNEDYDINDFYNGITPLHLAILFSRTQTIKHLLNKMDVDVTKCDERGRSPIQMAAMFSTKGPEIIELLLQTNQVHINDQDEARGNTALHMAALVPNVENVRYLLKRGANPNAINKEGQTPLHAAVFSGENTKVIDLLLNSNPNVNIDRRDRNELTPLHYAIRESNVKIARHLLKNGADPKVVDYFGRNSLHLASIYGKNVEIIDVLLENGKVQVNDCDKKNGNTPLHHAVGVSNVLTARHLLERNANPKAVNNYKHTTLHKAAMDAVNTEIIDLLLKKVNVDQPGVMNLTPLHFAVTASNILTTRFLLEKGADPNAPMDDNTTPLHAAALTSENTEIVDLLLDTKLVDINSTNKSGMTPLHYATCESNVKVVRHLLEKGADPKISDDLGRTSLDIAAIFGKNVELIDVLLSTGKVSVDDRDEKTGDTALHRAAMNSNALTASHLLKKGANPKAINKNKHTALHTAAMEAENTDIIDVFLKYLNVDERSETNKTPLHCAVMESNIIATRYLIERGAFVNARDNMGLNAILMAAITAKDVTIIQLLLQQNGNIEFCDRKGNNIFDYANANNDDFMSKSIVKLVKGHLKTEEKVKFFQHQL